MGLLSFIERLSYRKEATMLKHFLRAALLKSAEQTGPLILRTWIRSLRVTIIAVDESIIPPKDASTGGI